jgi:GntR family transcriptional regulator
VFIEIDPSLPQPLFEQVAMQIKFAIAAGTVRSNEMIPSVRDLARQLAINPNTVVRAYRLLQDEEVLVTRRGMGLVVTENSQSECQKQRKDFFKQRFQSFLNEAARSRLSQGELDEILHVTPTFPHPSREDSISSPPLLGEG